MSASTEFVQYVSELLAPLGQLDAGTFFGGHAIKFHGAQFAMVMGNTLYFRVSDSTRPAYEHAGSEPFSYSTKKGIVKVRKYYAAPEHILEDQAEMLAWARQAIDAAAAA